MNALFNTDFYKIDHWRMYPEGTESVYSNFTPRSSKHFNQKFDDKKVVFFGLQAILLELTTKFNSNFFADNKIHVIDEYKGLISESLGIDYDDVQVKHLEDLHELGYLPIKVKALPEGSRVDVGVPMFTITNTHPKFYWIVNFLETYLSAQLWKICTNATIAAHYKTLLSEWAEKTGGDKSAVDFQGHDFSFRGMSGVADAGMSGMGHLLSFMGTDTIPAIVKAKKFYTASGPVGMSVPATEHSIQCAGTKEGELATYRRLINELYPTGIVSIVSDTWDYWKVITEFTVELKEEILARKPNKHGLAKVVFRPDSGDPADIVCGVKVIQQLISGQSVKGSIEGWLSDSIALTDDELCSMYDECSDDTNVVLFKNRFGAYTKIVGKGSAESVTSIEHNYELTLADKGSIECLWDVFGGTINEKGYKVLNERVGLIYGDSITLERANEICKRLEAKGFASTNIVFGIGSASYQGGI